MKQWGKKIAEPRVDGGWPLASVIAFGGWTGLKECDELYKVQLVDDVTDGHRQCMRKRASSCYIIEQRSIAGRAL